MKEALTKKQIEVFHFVKTFIKENEFAPSLSEIQKKFKYKSPKAVVDMLNIIERKGYIKRGKKGQSRSIVILENEKENESNSSNDSIKLLITGKGNSNNPFSIFTNPRGELNIDKKLIDDAGNYFIIIVEDNGFKKEGIIENDHVIIKQENNFKDDQIVAAILLDKLIVRKYKKTNEGFELIASDKRFPKIPGKFGDPSVVVIGEVKLHIRKY